MLFFQSIILTALFPRILFRLTTWVKSCKLYSLEFEERQTATWVFVRTWEKDSLRRVCIDVIDRYFGDASTELTVLGRVMSSVPDDCRLVSLIGGSHTLIQTYSGYSGSGNTQKVVDQAVFDLRLLRRCMQKSASVVFGSMDPFSMTEFVIVRLKARSIKTGCRPGRVCEKPSRLVSWSCRPFLTSSSTLSACGH